MGAVVRLDVNPGRFFLLKLLGNACFSLFPFKVGRTAIGRYCPLIHIVVGVSRLCQYKLAVNIGNPCFRIGNIHMLTEAVIHRDIIARLYRRWSGIQLWRVTAGTQFDFNIAYVDGIALQIGNLFPIFRHIHALNPHLTGRIIRRFLDIHPLFDRNTLHHKGGFGV